MCGKNPAERKAIMKTINENTASKALSPQLLAKINAYWRAANYLSVGQIYLYDNPLLNRRITLAGVKVGLHPIGMAQPSA